MSTRHYLHPRSGAHGFDHDPNHRGPSIFLLTVDMIPPESYQPTSPLREWLRTPHLDRLMGDSVRFVNAMSVSPLCAPSRAAYLTGRYPYLLVNEERAHDGSEVALRDSDAIFPQYLKAVGYQLRHAGKSHVGTSKFLEAFGENDTPWNRWAAPLGDDDGYVRYLSELGVGLPVWPAPLRGLRPDRKTEGNSYGGWITQDDGSDFPAEATYSHYLATLGIAALDRARAQAVASGAPVYVQVDFFAPHQPFMVPTCYRARARELAPHLELPASYHEAMAGGGARWPRVYEFYRRNWGLYDAAAMRDYMLLNFLEIEALDAAIGRFVAALQERGLYEDSVIIFTGDHGEMNGERGLIDKGVYGHPRVARVPLSVKLPGGEGQGTSSEALVSLLDLAPTVLELAGVAPTERLDGRSLVPLMRDTAADAEQPFLFECGWHVCPNPAIATFARLADGRRYMYTYNLTCELDELYDLDDPHYRDLSRVPAFAPVKHEMMRRLGRFLEADPRWTCYWHTYRLAKYEHLDIGGGDFQMLRPH